MKNKLNLWLKLSIIVNVVLIFFGSYLGNLYIIQILGLGLAILACNLQNLKIKSNTLIWLIVILVSVMSIIVSNDKQSTIEVLSLIIMAITLKVIYGNRNNNNWQKYFMQITLIVSSIHVVATILQLIFPSFIATINTFILGAEGIKMNEDLLIAGAYAGITSQTSVNAFFIAIFVGIAFLKTFFEKKYKKINTILLIIGIIALFLTGKRGMLLYTVLSMIAIFLYTAFKDRKNILKYISMFIVIGVIGYIVIVNIPEAKYIFEKMSLLEEQGNILNGRDVLWQKSIDVFKANIIGGLGLGTIQNFIGEYSHNIYIQLLAETGVLGFLVYIIAIVGSFLVSVKKVGEALENGEIMEKILTCFAIFIQIIFIAYGMSGNPLYSQMFLVPYMISIAIIESIQINEGDEKNESRDNYLS